MPLCVTPAQSRGVCVCGGLNGCAHAPGRDPCYASTLGADPRQSLTAAPPRGQPSRCARGLPRLCRGGRLQGDAVPSMWGPPVRREGGSGASNPCPSKSRGAAPWSLPPCGSFGPIVFEAHNAYKTLYCGSIGRLVAPEGIVVLRPARVRSSAPERRWWRWQPGRTVPTRPVSEGCRGYGSMAVARQI